MTEFQINYDALRWVLMRGAVTISVRLVRLRLRLQGGGLRYKPSGQQSSTG